MTESMATFTTETAKKQFYGHKVVDDVEESFPIRFQKNMVIVTTKWNEKVVFSKSNRGKQFNDSRGRKTVRKNEWGDKIESIAPLMLSESQLMEELSRLLDSPEQAKSAFDYLQI